MRSMRSLRSPLLRLSLRLQGRAERAGPGWPPILDSAARGRANSARGVARARHRPGAKSGNCDAPGAVGRS
jgi:hypothetical protein